MYGNKKTKQGLNTDDRNYLEKRFIFTIQVRNGETATTVHTSVSGELK